MTHRDCSTFTRFLTLAIFAGLLVGPGRAAEKIFASTNIDSAFLAGLAKVKQATGSVTTDAGALDTAWRPGLQLLVGVKAVEGTKQTLYFIELKTAPPPATNSAGLPWAPLLRTNRWAWSRTNKVKFITTNYPVLVQVFDENGKSLKQGQTPMAWGMSTDGLLDFCRASVEVFGGTNAMLAPPAAASKYTNVPPDRVMRAMGGGFLWMMKMFGDLQTVPTVSDVWSTAQCAFRWPSLWGLAKSMVKGFRIEMYPRPERVALVTAADNGPYSPLFCMPLDIRHEGRDLTHVQILIAPPHGAEMLFGGIRTIHARHPTKAKHEFITQVLSTGFVTEK